MPEALEKWPVPLLEQRAAAAPADHLRDQPPLPGGGGRRLARRQRAPAADVAHRGRATQAGAHGEPGHRRQPLGQRRRGAAQPSWCKTTLVPDFYQLWPEQVQQQDQRRHAAPLARCRPTPALARLITGTIGDGWITDLDRLRDLEPCARDAALPATSSWPVKRANKERLAGVIAKTTGGDRRSRFAVRRAGQAHPRVQAAAAQRAAHHPRVPVPGRGRHAQPAVPRTYVFAGKAAPGYWAAKQIIS